MIDKVNGFLGPAPDLHMSLQTDPARKSCRLVAVCPPDLHEAFLSIADRTGESGSSILRRLAHEAVERARRGEPVVAGLMAGAPIAMEG